MLGESHRSQHQGIVPNYSENILGEDLPRLRVISDTPLCRNGYGFSRTLSNLFRNYSANQISFLVPRAAGSLDLQSQVQCDYFNEETIPQFHKRFLRGLNPFIEKINNSILALSSLRFVSNTDIYLISGSLLSTMIAGWKQIKRHQAPYIMYLMDDLRAIDSKRWLKSTGRALMQDLLANASGWLMISEELAKAYEDLYNINRPSTLIAHNSVPRNMFSQTPYPRKQNLSLAYAGSLFGMHFDALLLLAQAVSELQKEGIGISFDIYTTNASWEYHSRKFQDYNVQYGGDIPYEELHQTLGQHHLLVVASSFDPQYEQLTKSSVQTKLTDYMASQRATLCIGPENSACINFVRKWGNGYVFTANKLNGLKKLLVDLSNSHEDIKRIGEDAQKIAWNVFSNEEVEKKLFQFIKSVALQKRAST